MGGLSVVQGAACFQPSAKCLNSFGCGLIDFELGSAHLHPSISLCLDVSSNRIFCYAMAWDGGFVFHDIRVMYASGAQEMFDIRFFKDLAPATVMPVPGSQTPGGGWGHGSLLYGYVKDNLGFHFSGIEIAGNLR
ncbi:MAG: hypothetical protein MUE46_07060 [Xanthomonadales bacterium]|nr:hypothetical protein [Xanthomonadales bacterium]